MINYLKVFFSPSSIFHYKEKYFVNKLIKQSLINLENSKWLDDGCGSRPFEHNFKKHVYIGVDIKKESYAQAEKKADIFYDGLDLPFEDAIFDGVLSTQVIGLCEDDLNYVSEINRVLKKNGKLIISAPFIFREVEQPNDYRRFTSFGIEKILKDHNFEIIENIKCLSACETIGMLLSNYLSNNFKSIFIKRIVIVFCCFPIQITFYILSLILPDNKDLFYSSIVLAEKK